MESQQLSLQQKYMNDKENMYPKVELEKKHNLSLISERKSIINSTKFSQRLESIEDKIEAHYQYMRNIEVPSHLCP